MDASHTMPARRCALLLAALCGSIGAVCASDQVDAAVTEPAYSSAHEQAPWLQPIDRDRPIRRMSALRTEYRRIRDLRMAQIQPEYERRLAEGDDADAWRERTLRDVAKRDLRDLRARLDR